MTLATILPLPKIDLKKTTFEALPGYHEDTLKGADQAWERSCTYWLSLPPAQTCLFQTDTSLWQHLAKVYLQKKEDFRAYLLRYFDPYEICPLSPCERLFTGYYEPELPASRVKTSVYSYPIYRRPKELIVVEDLGIFRESLSGHRIAGFIKDQSLMPAFTRREIQEGVLEDQNLEICWTLDPVDLYFMHIQGGGKVIFEDTSWSRLSYDGTNGHAYHSLGKEMIKRGLVSAKEGSMQSMKAILRESSSILRKELLSFNPSYVFFKEIGSQEGPIGRIGKPLTRLRSLAVDPRAIDLGMPVWLGTSRISGFMTAQDVGGAIKGFIRGDIFCGTGEEAGDLAGHLKEDGQLFILLPKKEFRPSSL
jgi:membrane-bound lytic murein transglycosylase A